MLKKMFLGAACCMLLNATEAFGLSSRTCNPDVPSSVKYRTRHSDCDGNAAIILSGKYYRAFSVVLKKVDHGDRLGNQCPDASCSPFKTQKTIYKNNERISCLGASGFSKVFNGYDPYLGFNSAFVAKWISIKVRNSGQIKDVHIYCLPKPYPKTDLN